jgi:abequosyltransferase
LQYELSICIPTYNRAGALKETLENITSKETFACRNDIEIAISDNASADNTEEVAKTFLRRFPGKINYYKNKENVFDRNFELALSRGNGSFLKLCNDSTLYTDAALDIMLDVVRKNKEEKNILFFIIKMTERQACITD